MSGSAGGLRLGAPSPEHHDDSCHLQPVRARVGISACLLGLPARADGNRVVDAFLETEIGPRVEWVPVCPEVEAGMEVPRPPLVQIRDRGIRVVSGDGVDWTEALTAACEETLTRLAERDLCGYIVKDCSPTCGATRVRVEDGGRREVEGVGVFTRALRQRLPNLPIEAETHLHDPTVRDGFLDAVFAHARWHAVRQSGLTAARLAAFHARNIYLLWAHSPTHANKLAAIVEAARVEAAHAEPTCEQLSAELGRRYQVLYMAAFRARATIRRHVYAMRQIAAELAPRLSARDGVEIEAVIDAYEAGAVPRRVPIALLGRHALAAGELVGHSYLLCDAD